MTISRLLSAAALFQENSAKIVELEEELSTSLRDVIAGRDDMDAAFLEDDEVQALSGLTLRVETLSRVRNMSAWMEEEEGGKQSSAWTIFMSLAARGSRGTKDEDMVRGDEITCVEKCLCRSPCREICRWSTMRSKR